MSGIDRRPINLPRRQKEKTRSTFPRVVTDKNQELQNAYRMEYPVVAVIWRFVIATRGLLFLTAMTGVTAAMNNIRVNYFKVREVIITGAPTPITLADDSIGYLFAAGVILVLTAVGYAVVSIDKELGYLQQQEVDRGMFLEKALGIGFGTFNRAHLHETRIEWTFVIGRVLCLLVILGWALFAISVSRPQLPVGG